jgi:chlorite dismutase
MAGLAQGAVSDCCFHGGVEGEWQVEWQRAVCGAPLAAVPALAVRPTSAAPPEAPVWTLRGVTSHLRYATQAEVGQLAAVQEGLGRPQARCAALIPIRKSAAWWALAQDQRREIFEAQSRHTEIGLRYLPAIARRLYHSRDLGEAFDFLTWFEFAAEDAAAFDHLLLELRAGPEWHYVERESELRLSRRSPSSVV